MYLQLLWGFRDLYVYPLSFDHATILYIPYSTVTFYKVTFRFVRPKPSFYIFYFYLFGAPICRLGTFRCTFILSVKDVPSYFPWCTLQWHSLHSGTCFLFILANSLSKLFSLGFIVLMCFKWCISIPVSTPQLAQTSFIDLTFHSPAYRGFLKSLSNLKAIGSLTEGTGNL